MSIIKILPESLVNQIAAGEVVERPASVVKELVENSLDAGAGRIGVEIKNGGSDLIKISDDGKGMTAEDLELALQRHATSKIAGESDLWNIRTMGFRGEALASISSVSRLSIRSKTANEDAGREINCEAGEIFNIVECGMNPGTQVEVRNLFFNTPARQKYLKKESTEIGHISQVFNTIALAHPGVSFKLIHNGKTVSELAKSSDLKSRIADIFGSNTAEAMLPLFYGGSEFQLSGFVGKPVISRSTGQHQYFFVNGRPIQHYLLANTIKQAFHSMLMENRKPVFVINIQIDPSLIDVNVHPRKLEIRFEDQQTLIRVIYSAVKSALEKTDLKPKAFTESQRYMADSFPAETRPRVFGGTSSGGYSAYKPAVRANTQEAFEFNERISRGIEGQIKAIFQVANSYIIARDEHGIVLVDQHAAHERVRYEQLMDEYEKQQKSTQKLLLPLQMELSGAEKNLLADNLETFEALGFEIEEFGGNTFVANAVPAALAKESVDEILRGVLDDLSEEKKTSNLQGRKETILTYMSCRSAIKFGQKLDLQEMNALLLQMEKLKRPYTCPHGRPTMLSLSLAELEKMFGRK